MHRVIIDADPGQDDAFALLLALASPDIEVVGVTTVAGNVAVGQTADNARRIVELAGRGDVKVFAGASAMLVCGAKAIRLTLLLGSRRNVSTNQSTACVGSGGALAGAQCQPSMPVAP